MTWVIILALVAAGFVFYTSKQVAVQVPIENGLPGEDLEGVEFYWRPGCPFCMRLKLMLKTSGIAMNERNIWENPDDAATVRSVAGGNETVPTLVIGPIALVNPSLGQVKEALAQHAPHLL